MRYRNHRVHDPHNKENDTASNVLRKKLKRIAPYYQKDTLSLAARSVPLDMVPYPFSETEIMKSLRKQSESKFNYKNK